MRKDNNAPTYRVASGRGITHMTSTVVLANALYSLSVLDQATVACFLEDQETKLLAR
jgi:hypothetical protein